MSNEERPTEREPISRRHFIERSAAGVVALSVFPTAEVGAAGPARRQEPAARNHHYVSNREPLTNNPYLPLPLGAIRPAGWLRGQLDGWALGMTGQLDEVWPDVGPDNGWLGGEGDVWERGPYWLDGLVPLAYALQSEALIEKANHWIEATIASARPDGFFGPEDTRAQRGGGAVPGADWWPRMVMLKVLQQHHEATGNERVLQLMTEYFRYQQRELPSKSLGSFTYWGQRRGGENLASIHWLYNRTGDAFLLELGELVFQQTEDWTKNFTTDHGIWHVVNTAMGIKQPAVWYQQSGDRKYLDAVEAGIAYLMREHGQPQGIWSGDELLHGTNPTQGVETCAVVEYMFSLETLLYITGSVRHADRLERVAYNALPAALSPYFAGRHYYQLPNQIACTREYHNFSTRHDDDALIGLETGYGCCTANLHQGWPKFVAQLWLATPDDGLAALVYGPCEVTARVAEGAEVRFQEETSYPFEDDVRFVYHGPSNLAFPLYLRVPGWCEVAALRVNDRVIDQPEAGRIVRLERRWEEGDRITLHLPLKIQGSRWHERSAVLERGPLVFALRREEKWTGVKGTRPYVDYLIRSDEPWNFGLLREDLEHPDEAYEMRRLPIVDQPWSAEGAPLELTGWARRVYEWKRYGGITGPIPWSPIPSRMPDEKITLVPYGCTEIRITEFPVVVRA